MAPEPVGPRASGTFGLLAADVRAERQIALHALSVLEYAVTAPTPRRQRTWSHRVMIAVEALQAALQARMHATDSAVHLLDEIALSNPDYVAPIQGLRQELLDLTIAVASLRELIEPDPIIEVDPDDVRDRLAGLARQFREHQAREARLVDQATGLNLDDAV